MKNKKTFTLAEVLIVIGIIGIVAALSLPTLITKIKNKVKETQITVVEKKIFDGTSLMHVNGEIGPYYPKTEDFINTLQKHLKIIQICDGVNIPLSQCMSYEFLEDTKGNKFNINDLKTGSKIGMLAKNKIKDYSSQNVGIILADGTPMILSFNKNCQATDPDSRNDNPYECISGIYDLNGAKGPNKFGLDVVGFNGGFVGCGMKAGAYCLSSPIIPTPLSIAECKELKSSLNIPSCTVDNNYWAGAYAECGGASNMISRSDAQAIANSIYDKNVCSSCNITYSLTWISTTADALKNKTIWTSGEYEYGGWLHAGEYALYNNSASYYRNEIADKTDAGVYAVCIIEKNHN